MWRRWPVVVSIAVIGLPVAVAVGGVPSSPDTPALGAADTTSTTPVTEPPATLPAPTTTTTSPPPPVTEPPVTEPPVTEPPVTEPPVTEPPVTEPPVTEPPVTEPPVTEAPVAEPAVAAPVDDGLRPRSTVRLFVADGHRSGERTAAIAAALSALGYATTTTGVNRSVSATTIYYHAGFEGEAVRLVADLGLPGADVRPVPASSGTSKDDLADIIAVVGPEVAL